MQYRKILLLGKFFRSVKIAREKTYRYSYPFQVHISVKKEPKDVYIKTKEVKVVGRTNGQAVRLMLALLLSAVSGAAFCK